MMRRTVPVFLILTLLAAVLVSNLSAALKPNLVIILTDDQDLGSLAYMPRTRELIGAQGLTFRSYFVPLSLCCPARATILTGLYTHNHKVYTNFPPDGGFERFEAQGHEQKTLATALHDAGYRTALIGKYLNGYPNKNDPTHIPPGWDEWVSPVQGSPYAAYRYTLNENGKLVKHGSKAEDYMTDLLSKKAQAFVRSAGGQPFFLYLATYAPHKPATPAKRHLGLFPGLQAPRTPSFNEAAVRDKPARIRNLKRLKPPAIAAIDALYRKQVLSLQAVDEAVAALIQTLRDTGQLDNTFLVFTSDNGFHMGQHRLQPGKYTPYEPDVHVPLLVRGPGVPAGGEVTALASAVDLAPTLAALAGATLPVEPDGRSLVPFLQGQAPAAWRQAVLLEQFKYPPAPPDDEAISDFPAHMGLRTESLKYVEYGNGEREVYDLNKDPDEMLNLRDRVALGWLGLLSQRVKALGACKGETCRRIEAQPVPGL
ncbi:MAG: sulfatase [Thermoanaerobaculia bacterium]